MVDSDKGITNLHVPVRRHRRRLDAGDDPHLRPDVERRRRAAGHPRGDPRLLLRRRLPGRRSTTAATHGAFDPSTMGSVPNVGLMAKAAEEYGSHDKTFEIPAAGTVEVRQRRRRRADVARRSRPATSGAPARPRTSRSATGSSSPSPAPVPAATPAIFWLDEARAHDANLIAKVNAYLPEHDTDGPRHRDHGAGRGDDVLARADPPGRGHHLGDRQRAARLQHRPVPDPRARHQRQDALGRPADERRRPLRDRRRRLGAQARAAARQGELPPLGQPR